jgi:3-oxoacyl-[acyl-carrier protein] reductase
MTYSAARELAPRGITVNAIAPGMINTDMTAVLSDKVKENILAGIPLKRFGEPEEIAQTAVFLAKSKYITGQVITVDGGMVIG